MHRPVLFDTIHMIIHPQVILYTRYLHVSGTEYRLCGPHRPHNAGPSPVCFRRGQARRSLHRGRVARHHPHGLQLVTWQKGVWEFVKLRPAAGNARRPTSRRHRRPSRANTTRTIENL